MLSIKVALATCLSMLYLVHFVAGEKNERVLHGHLDQK
jgi:hypothetical protein